jgi:hypothetical protein
MLELLLYMCESFIFESHHNLSPILELLLHMCEPFMFESHHNLSPVLEWLSCTCASRSYLNLIKISAQFRNRCLGRPNVPFLCDSHQTSKRNLLYELRLDKPMLIQRHAIRTSAQASLVRDNHGSRNRDVCPYLVGSPNEQSH